MTTGIKKYSMYDLQDSKSTISKGIRRYKIGNRDDSWSGIVEVEPESNSDWHRQNHSAIYLYVIEGNGSIEYGEDGEKSIKAVRGDFLEIPANTTYRNVNAGETLFKAFVVRVGSNTPVFDSEGENPRVHR